MIQTIVFNFLFAVFIGLANGWIAKNLEQTTVNDARLNTIFKSQWHNYGMLPLRVLVPLMFAWLCSSEVIIALHSQFVSLSVIGLCIQFISYDSIIDMTRRKFTFRYIATCEGSWDFDCFWLKLQEWHINHLVVKSIIVAVVIYFFS